MATFRSTGDRKGDSRLSFFTSLFRSDFTAKFLICKGFFNGFTLPVNFHGSCWIPIFPRGNFQSQPPGTQFYKFPNFCLRFNIPSFRLIQSQTEPITMSDLRKSIQDLDLGIDDEPLTLPQEFIARAASVNRFALVVTAVNPRK